MKLPLEYVALLAFYATDVGKERRSKARQILLRVIQLRREYMVMNSSMFYWSDIVTVLLLLDFKNFDRMYAFLPF